jgi:hypothetical protein
MSSAPTARPGWEYCRLTLRFNEHAVLVYRAASNNVAGSSGDTTFDESLERLGKDGWELVTFIDSRLGVDERLAYFKRPLR